MARVKITDLPKDMKINKEVMKTIFGGSSRKSHDYIASFEGYGFIYVSDQGGMSIDPVMFNLRSKNKDYTKFKKYKGHQPG